MLDIEKLRLTNEEHFEADKPAAHTVANAQIIKVLWGIRAWLLCTRPGATAEDEAVISDLVVEFDNALEQVNAKRPPSSQAVEP